MWAWVALCCSCQMHGYRRLRIVLAALYMLDYRCPTINAGLELTEVQMFGPWISALMAILQACYLHHVDFSLRLPCRVMVAYLSVFLLFHNTGYHQQVRTWKRRLQHLFQASLQSFSSMMQRQFAVYALLHVNAETSGRGQWLQNKTFYVCSTTTGIHVRQDARWRKHRCLEQGQFVNVELVMHYLHTRGLLHEVAIVPLFNLVNATVTRSKEIEIIQNW